MHKAVPAIRHRSAPHRSVPFVPHPLLRGGHRQTLAAVYLPGPRYHYRATLHTVPLADGDRIVLHDDAPNQWQAGDRTAILLHGLAGNHRSGYMQRVAYKLVARGVRTFRMDMRGTGAGAGLAQLPYHAGRSDDAAAALSHIATLAPGSPTTLVGFSLGGNVALKLLGELGAAACGGLDRAVAICPPIDLAACSENISRRTNRVYDLHFVRALLAQIERRQNATRQAEGVGLARRPRRLKELDDTYTAPVSGFGTADNYYRLCSSQRLLAGIRRPTLILAAEDDPLVPAAQFHAAKFGSDVSLVLSRHGGHLGFIARSGADADCRWMDWRIVDWVCGDEPLAAHAY